jgi:lactoylglutathione lyase
VTNVRAVPTVQLTGNMITKIRSAAIVVRNGQKAKEWYRDKLGFVVKSDQEHWITVAPRGTRDFEIHLCEMKPLEKGNTGIVFQVNDLDKAYQDLVSKGVKFEKKPVDEGWGPYALMKDLDGNVFWLME